jgi:hypothetical protein
MDNIPPGWELAPAIDARHTTGITHAAETDAAAPPLEPGEVMAHSQRGVGLYDGSARLDALGEGRVFLTSHRIVFITIAAALGLSSAADYGRKGSGLATAHGVPSRPGETAEALDDFVGVNFERAAIALPLSRVRSASKASGFGWMSHPKVTLVLNNTAIGPPRLSFREGGSETFFTRLNHMLDQRHWLRPPPPPMPSSVVAAPNAAAAAAPTMGAARQLQLQQQQGAAAGGALVHGATAPGSSAAATTMTSGDAFTRRAGIVGLERDVDAASAAAQAQVRAATEEVEDLIRGAREVVGLLQRLRAQQTAADAGGAAVVASDADREALEALDVRAGLTSAPVVQGASTRAAYIEEVAAELSTWLGHHPTWCVRAAAPLSELYSSYCAARGATFELPPSDFAAACLRLRGAPFSTQSHPGDAATTGGVSQSQRACGSFLPTFVSGDAAAGAGQMNPCISAAAAMARELDLTRRIARWHLARSARGGVAAVAAAVGGADRRFDVVEFAPDGHRVLIQLHCASAAVAALERLLGPAPFNVSGGAAGKSLRPVRGTAAAVHEAACPFQVAVSAEQLATALGSTTVVARSALEVLVIEGLLVCSDSPPTVRVAAVTALPGASANGATVWYSWNPFALI